MKCIPVIPMSKGAVPGYGYDHAMWGSDHSTLVRS